MGPRLSQAEEPKEIPQGPYLDPMQNMSQWEYVRYIANAPTHFSQRYDANKCLKVQLGEFDVEGKFGEGRFGSVYLVKHKETGEKYALKVQPKRFTQEFLMRVSREKRILHAVQNKFVVQLAFANQNTAYIYLYTEPAVYGDLKRQLENMTECLVKHECLHECKILHRGLKVDKVLIFEDRFVKLTDFELSKVCPEGWTTTFCGCPRYQSPEVILRKEYGKDFDFWLLGSLIFELLYKKPPFYVEGKTAVDNQQAALFSNVPFPEGVRKSSPSSTIIQALLAKNQHERLGMLFGGIQDVKKHPWFRDINFLDVFNKTIPQDPLFGRRKPDRFDKVVDQFIFHGRELAHYGAWNEF